jgi:uncharacterized protein
MFDNVFAICLLVADVERSIAFYNGVLGLMVKDRDGGFANFRLRGTELAIFQQDGAVAMFPKKYMKPAGGAVLAFRVDDIEKGCEMLRVKGAGVFEGPKITSWDQRVAYFHDPDGYVWEISQK